jgi:transposase
VLEYRSSTQLHPFETVSYPPDLNLIKEAFSKVKVLLRRAGAQIREALVEALGAAFDGVTAGTLAAFSSIAVTD